MLRSMDNLGEGEDQGPCLLGYDDHELLVHRDLDHYLQKWQGLVNGR